LKLLHQLKVTNNLYL